MKRVRNLKINLPGLTEEDLVIVNGGASCGSSDLCKSDGSGGLCICTGAPQTYGVSYGANQLAGFMELSSDELPSGGGSDGKIQHKYM